MQENHHYNIHKVYEYHEGQEYKPIHLHFLETFDYDSIYENYTLRIQIQTRI